MEKEIEGENDRVDKFRNEIKQTFKAKISDIWLHMASLDAHTTLAFILFQLSVPI